jgi:hypothetical protein
MAIGVTIDDALSVDLDDATLSLTPGLEKSVVTTYSESMPTG